MTINITLVCAGGMSTSLLVQKMREAANKYPAEEINIVASPEKGFKKLVNQTDIVMLGPQISYLEEQMRKTYADKNIAIMVIDSIDYGLINGEKVLDEAMKLRKKS